MEQTLPFRLLDPTGRNLVWVKINEEKFSENQTAYDSPECRIVMCPRPGGAGSPPDMVSRPCHRYGGIVFRLKDEFHEWLESLGMDRRYQFEFRYANGEFEPAWHLGFLEADKDKAALVKLTLS